MISYLIRYNWAYTCGAIKPLDDYRGLAYNDMIPVPLDEVDEMALTLCKEYKIDYRYLMEEMYYSDVTMLYAKHANERAFSSYNDYLNLSEEQKGKYVSDYGVPKPYVYELLTAEKQKENIENKGNNSLKEIYRHGGNLIG